MDHILLPFPALHRSDLEPFPHTPFSILLTHINPAVCGHVNVSSDAAAAEHILALILQQ